MYWWRVAANDAWKIVIECAFDGTAAMVIGFVLFWFLLKCVTTCPVWAAPIPHIPSFMTEPWRGTRSFLICCMDTLLCPPRDSCLTASPVRLTHKHTHQRLHNKADAHLFTHTHTHSCTQTHTLSIAHTHTQCAKVFWNNKWLATSGEILFKLSDSQWSMLCLD